MSDTISKAIEAIDEVRDLISVEAYCAITERLKMIPTANGDLISRQDAIDEIEYELEMINSALDSITLDYNARERLRQRKGEAREILNSIQQLPSAERKGKWIRTYLDHEAMGIRPSILYCSECQQCIAYPTNYCPNCGARMVSEDAE